MLSPRTKTVMNDGVGRMSLGLMKKVRDGLGLLDLPSAVQGRLGSAKGMWIVDMARPTDEVWIETYPSQEKWNWADPAHRTFEVRAWSSQLRSASINLQLLPILEDRSSNKELLREVIGEYLQQELKRDLESLKLGLKRPEYFRQWLFERDADGCAAAAANAAANDTPTWLAGLPDRDVDVMAFLLDGGFGPTQLDFFWDMVVKRQRQKGEKLRQKMHVPIGQSAYAFMVVDFCNVLKEDEVHICFSSRFQDEVGEFSDTMLDGLDMLVVRTPAHLPSDLQRVRAVFKAEMRHLKDVIVFAAAGEVPLAHKLSGGDYDGDLAWVCCDQRLVRNFSSVPPPPEPDLSPFYSQGKARFSDRQEGQHKIDKAVAAMVREGFVFSLRKNHLPILTDWKERFAYKHNSISGNETVMLSYMLGKLVDQSKQGIIFTDKDFRRLREAVGVRYQLPKQLYKHKSSRYGDGPHLHIIDHLRFDVAERTIQAALDGLKGIVDEIGTKPSAWDTDLMVLHNNFDQLARSAEGRAAGLWETYMQLRTDVEACASLWTTSIRTGDGTLFRSSVCAVFDQWRGIRPVVEKLTGSIPLALVQGLLPRGELSDWELLKASSTFMWHYRKMPRFVWRIAGVQLQHIKAMAVAQRMRPDESRTSATAAFGRRDDDGDDDGDDVDDDGQIFPFADDDSTGMAEWSTSEAGRGCSDGGADAERLVLVRGGEPPSWCCRACTTRCGRTGGGSGR